VQERQGCNVLVERHADKQDWGEVRLYCRNSSQLHESYACRNNSHCVAHASWTKKNVEEKDKYHAFINFRPRKRALDGLGYISVAEYLRLSSTTFTQCVPEAAEFGEITQNMGHFAVQGHLRSPILLPIESLYTSSH